MVVKGTFISRAVDFLARTIREDARYPMLMRFSEYAGKQISVLKPYINPTIIRCRLLHSLLAC